jgi:hypothetical protein
LARGGRTISSTTTMNRLAGWEGEGIPFSSMKPTGGSNQEWRRESDMQLVTETLAAMA